RRAATALARARARTLLRASSPAAAAWRSRIARATPRSRTRRETGETSLRAPRDRRFRLCGLQPVAQRQRQPYGKTHAVPAVGAIEHFDAAGLRERVVARDGKPQTRALHLAVERRLAGIERVEYAIALGRRDPRTMVGHVEHREPVLLEGVELDHA